MVLERLGHAVDEGVGLAVDVTEDDAEAVVHAVGVGRAVPVTARLRVARKGEDEAEGQALTENHDGVAALEAEPAEVTLEAEDALAEHELETVDDAEGVGGDVGESGVVGEPGKDKVCDCEELAEELTETDAVAEGEG